MPRLFGRGRFNIPLHKLEAPVRRLLEQGIEPERIAAIIAGQLPETVQRAGDSLARALLDRAPELVDQHKDYARFRKRLARTWNEAFTLYDVILVSVTEAGSEFNREYRPAAARENDLVFEALIRLHAQACLVASEVFELLKGGFPHGAHARVRTLHELAVFASVIGDHGGSTVAERFLSHDSIENATAADNYQKFLAGRHGYEPFTDVEIAAIHTRRDEVISRFGKTFSGRYGWAAVMFNGKSPSFGQLEEVAGLTHPRPFYDWSTHIGVHASSRGTRLSLIRRGAQDELLAGPTNAGLADPGHRALISLIQVTTTLLIRARPLGTDAERLVVLIALLKLTDQAGEAFLTAHRRLMAKEDRFQKRIAASNSRLRKRGR